MPSTEDLTKAVAGMRFPAAVKRGTPILFGPDQNQATQYSRLAPILPLIYRTLTNEFDYVDFELILHAIEQLEPIVASAEDAYRHDQYRAVLSPFVELRHQLDFIDSSLLLTIRPLIIAKIHSRIINIPVQHFARKPALHRFIRNLDDQFRISVFTLNYDDIVDGARNSWFDGFTCPVDQSTQGRVWSATGFDASSFINWDQASEPLLVHLHGSTRFGYLRNEIGGTGKFTDAQAALDSIEGTRSGDNYSGGQIVSASPIISGLSKSAKLVHNPEPFGYYYRAFIDSTLACERLLVIGYGGRDDHINVWLDQYAKKHGKKRKVVWICKLTDSSIGETTPEKEMISSLAGPGGFQEYRHYDDPTSKQKFLSCGALGLVPSGFPVSRETEAQIVQYLNGVCAPGSPGTT